MRVKWTTSEIKETLLVLQAVIWASLLLLPGDLFALPSRIDIMSKYAPDHVWGSILLVVCLPFLFINRYKYRNYRKLVHVFLWTFWSGIFCLGIYRVLSSRSFRPTDLIVLLPFLTIALLHAVNYAGLDKEP